MIKEKLKNRPYYPVLLDLEGRKTVVVGGGKVALRKIETLLEYGAKVYVIAREMSEEVNSFVQNEDIISLGAEFEKTHLENAFLVIAATDDPSINHMVSMAAQDKGILVNAADQPADCTFILPSILRRGDLIIGISTSGKSPAMAKKIRETLEYNFGDEYSILLHLMGETRARVISKGFPHEENKKVFKRLADSDILDSIKKREWGQVAQKMSDILDISISKQDVLEHLGKVG